MRFFALVALALLPACATIIEGTDDTVTLSSSPAGATCTVDREGQRIAAVAATPSSIRIGKSRKDLAVACAKEGYQPSNITVTSSFTGTTFGNILAGGVIGVVVDAASGANSKYPPNVQIDLVENPRPAAAPMAGPAVLTPIPVAYTPRPGA